MRLGDFDNVGAAVRQLRTNLGTTAVAAAEGADMDPGHYTKVERGPSTDMRLRTLVKMLEGLGHEVHFLPMGSSGTS